MQILFQFNFGQLEPIIHTNFTVSCGFDSVNVNFLWKKNMEEYVKSELSDFSE